MSIVNNMMAGMSEEDKNKLGKSGTKINSDGQHLVKIIEAYEIGGTEMPRFYIKMEDSEGKTIDETLFLKQKVGKDKDGNVKTGEYFVNGVKTQLDTEGMEYDNVRALGQIKNLWKIVGNDPATFGAGVTPGTITFAQKGTQAIENWTNLIGKSLTIVSSYYISLDKDGKKAWRNQAINMDSLFTQAGFSQAEVDAGKTEPVAIIAAEAAAKANAGIEFKNKNNRVCMTELKLVNGAGTVPIKEAVTAEVDGEDPF